MIRATSERCLITAVCDGMTLNMAIPDLQRLTELQLKELRDKFAYYGDSWLDMTFEQLKQRIANEEKELNSVVTPIEKARKVVNICNLYAMLFDKYQQQAGEVGKK